MYFSEASLENKIIETLVNVGWKYVSSEDLPREYSSPMVESMVKSALIRLNPVIAENPYYADIVIQTLRTYFYSTETHNLIANNERFRDFILEHNSFPFGENGKHVPIDIFGTVTKRNLALNEYVVTNQWIYPSARNGKRLDIVLFVNGIPVVIGEVKTPIQEGITYLDAIADISDYEKSVSQMFATNIISFATDGKCFRYGSVKTPVEYWGPWYKFDHKKEGTIIDVLTSVEDMLVPAKILDIFEYYTIFTTSGKDFQKCKIVARYQQFEGANAIVNRVRDGGPKKGLIWHFQGSGKSLLMLFAARKLRGLPEFNSPTVVIVDDRVDLLSQTSAVFTGANVPGLVEANNIKELQDYLNGDLRKIIITTIFRFRDEENKVLNYSPNIMLLCDECHRTQDGDLARNMRTALPNAFFFGLTGTPINTLDRNTFNTFGSAEDMNNYMSKYDYADSLRDKATLPLRFETVPVELKISHAEIEDKLQDYFGDVSDDIQSALSSRMSIEVLFKQQRRVDAVCRHIYEHFISKIEPTGLKGQVVCYDRESCVAYKKALDKLFGNSDSTVVVMDTTLDKADTYKEYRLTGSEEESVLNRFRDKNDKLKLVIVTSKLLTGFDAPILQVMYLDKPMRNHTLLQAVCRTNRLYGQEKTYGLIVDYCGLFDEVAQSLVFDDEKMRHIVDNVDGVKDDFCKYMSICLNYFLGVDKSSTDIDSLAEAQERLADEKVKEEFGANYRALARAFEIISPDMWLNPYIAQYKWLSVVYNSIKPIDSTKLIWAIYGKKTLELIQGCVNVEEIRKSMDIVLSAEVVSGVIEEAEAAKKAKRLTIDIESILRARKDDIAYKTLIERLEELKEKYKKGLLSSIGFLKKLCSLATDVRQQEKYGEPMKEKEDAKRVLTRLFQATKNNKTPIIVERIVNDIDGIVCNTRFPGWKKSDEGRRQVNNALVEIFDKYRIDDIELFDKAYEYIEKYY